MDAAQPSQYAPGMHVQQARPLAAGHWPLPARLTLCTVSGGLRKRKPPSGAALQLVAKRSSAAMSVGENSAITCGPQPSPQRAMLHQRVLDWQRFQSLMPVPSMHAPCHVCVQQPRPVTAWWTAICTVPTFQNSLTVVESGR